VAGNVFEQYLERVVNCPSVELGKPKSPCHDIIKKDWAALLGWGNPDAPIVFVGLNPYLTPGAEEWHRPASGESLHAHAQKLSHTKDSGARHFAYHKRILRELKAKGVQVPSLIGEFAFFTEVACCPSTTQGGLNSEIIKQCFNQNVREFILESQFKVVITLGEIPSAVCARSFIGDEAFKRFSHGHKYQIPNSDKLLLTSFHPNARGRWDRSAITNELHKMYSVGSLAFNGQ
jgi:uracil-DNA glycosylase